MGCWNGTDFITQLPILYGEKVKLFILVSEEIKISGGGVCYTDTLSKPLALPITGEYDDYGSLQNCTIDHTAKKLLMFFKEKGEFNFPDYDKPKDDIYDLEKLIRWIERGYVEFKYGSKTYSVSVVMVLENVFNEIIKFIGEYDDCFYFKVGDKKVTGLEYFEDKVLNNIFLNYNANLSDTIKMIKEMEDNVEYLTRFACGFNYRDSHKELSFEDMVKLRKEVVSFNMFLFFMYETRKQFVIQSGAGSQTQSYDFHLKLANIIEEHSIHKLTEYDDEYSGFVNLTLSKQQEKYETIINTARALNAALMNENLELKVRIEKKRK